jgi:hypothetical protein
MDCCFVAFIFLYKMSFINRQILLDKTQVGRDLTEEERFKSIGKQSSRIEIKDKDKHDSDLHARHFFSIIELFELRKDPHRGWNPILLNTCAQWHHSCEELSSFNRSGIEDPKIFVWQVQPYALSADAKVK